MKSYHWFFFIFYFVLAAYMINFSFAFLDIPSFVSDYNDWIFFAVGIFLIYGAFVYYTRYRGSYGPTL